MSRSRPSAGDRGSCSAASLQPWEPRGGGPSVLTRSTRLDFQSVRKSLNCLNMPLRLTMMMAAKMA